MQQKQKQITQVFTSNNHKLVITISPDSAQQCPSCNLLIDKIYQYANQLLKDPQFSNHTDQEEAPQKQLQEHGAEGFQQPPSASGKQIQEEETHPNEQKQQVEEEKSQPKIPKHTPTDGKNNYEQDLSQNPLLQAIIALEEEEQLQQGLLEQLESNAFNRDEFSRKLQKQGLLVEKSLFPQQDVEKESSLSHQQNRKQLKQIRYHLKQIMKVIGSYFCEQVGQIDEELVQELRRQTGREDEEDLVAIQRKLGILLIFCGSIATLNKQYSQLVEIKFRKVLSKGEFGRLLQLKKSMLKEIKEMLMISGAHLSK